MSVAEGHIGEDRGGAHIAAFDNAARALLNACAAVALALCVTGALILISGKSPIAAYWALVRGVVGTPERFAFALNKSTPYILAGIGVALCFRAKVVNIGMTNGRGFVALAAIIVGRWTPSGTLLGCLLFGAVSALELRAHGWGLPVSSYVIQMLPYLAALALLAGIGRSARMPAAIGVPFVRH